MSQKIAAAQDNGVSGSIAIIQPDGTYFYVPTPVVKCLNYTKAKSFINRLDRKKYRAILQEHIIKKGVPCIFLLERPMINPGRWKASVSAIRCDEATRSVLEDLEIAFRYVDSKEWQNDSKLHKGMLPSGLEKEELKIASRQIGKQLFPLAKIKESGDADALLMAEFARRNNL